MRKHATLVAVLFILGLSNLHAQLTTISGPSTIQTGEFACYNFPFTWSSTTENVANGKIEIVLPAPLSDSPSDNSFNTPPFVSSASYNQATRTITWILDNPFFAGSSANLQFCCKFPNGSTPNNSMVTLQPTFTRQGAAPQSISTTLTGTATSKVKITKTILANPALNNDAVFLINVENPNEPGNIDLSNVSIKDPLPPGVNYVISSDGGMFSAPNVMWTIPTLAVGTTKTLRLTVQYTSPTFALGNTSTNVATLTSNELSPPGISASREITISPPNPSGSFSKSPFAPCPSLGGTAGWSIGVQNSGNVPLTNVIVEDMLPAEFFLNNALTVGADPNGNPATVTVQYQTVANATYVNWPGSPLVFPSNPITPSSQTLTAPAGSPITKVRLTWNSIPVGYSSGVSMSGIVNSPDKLGGIFSAGPTPALGHRITNMITNNYSFNGNPQPVVTINADLTIVAQLPKPVVSKNLFSNYNQEPGNEVQYQLCIANASDGVGNLVDPIIADLLPADVEYVPNSIENVSGPLGTPTLTESINAATNRPLLKFTWPIGSSLAIGQNTCFTIKVKIKAGAPAGVRSNKLYFLPQTTLNTCDNAQLNPDALDIDGDNNTSEIIPSTNDINFNVIQIAAVSSSKWVKGLCDSDFHRFPTVGMTTAYTGPGTGTFQYKLIIQNLGNEPLRDIRIMDVLPWVGDVGVITINSSRNTTYVPRFVSMDVIPAGITPKYSTQSNPTRTDLDATLSSPAGDVSGAFSNTLPANLADLKSILFDFGAIVLQPSETREILMTMRVPYGIVPSDIAWNSFGHRTDVLPSATVPKPIPAEPIKVGISAKVAKIGNYLWVDTNKNGQQDDGNTGLGSVTVRLLDGSGNPVINPETNQAVTTVTDMNGAYCFGVAPGTYMIKFDIPPAYNPTIISGNDASDSDIDATGKTGSYTVVGGEENLTIDAGVFSCGTGSISGRAWKDLDNNGTRNGAGEVDVPGITFNLYNSDANGNKVGATLQTQTGATYSFTGLGRGDYVVEVDKNQILQMSMLLSQQLNTGADNIDNDFIFATGLTERIVLDPCDPTKANIDNVDAGVTTLGSIGDKIWKDYNNNGIQDGGVNEAGIDGVLLRLFKADANGNKIGNAIDVKTTSNGGMYKFENLLEDMYVVEIDKTSIMAPMELSLKPNTGNDDNDSDFNPVTSLSHKINVVPTNPSLRDITNVDGGIVTLGSIGDKVWKDYNNNGIQDGGPTEAGIDGIVMNLYLSDINGNKIGNSIKTTTTSNGGMYKFSQLDEGMYVVELDRTTIMAPMELSLKPNRPNDDTDSDFDPNTGLSPKVTVVPNNPSQKDITNVDAGIVTLGSIGDKFWKDSNNNGIQDNGENGAAGIELELYVADGSGNPVGVPIKTTTTSAPDGEYRFRQLDEGMYFVKVVLSSIMSTMEISKKIDKGGDDSKDNDFNRFSGYSHKITVVPNDPSQKDILTVDGAIRNRIRGTIGDFVWKDLIENGIQENCEKGVPNIDLELYMKHPDTGILGSLDTITGVFTPNVPMFTTTTNAAGKYTFVNLEDETWVVKLVKSSIMINMEMSPLQNQGGNDALDNDFNVNTALSDEVPLDPYIPALRHNPTIDAAIRNTPCDNLKSNTATFSGTGGSAIGNLTIGNTNVNLNVVTTGASILRSTSNKASTLFSDNCYTTKPINGGTLTFRDNGGSNSSITINLGATVSNPILYFKDVIRRKLDLSQSVDANGNPICMKTISRNSDMQVNDLMMMMEDNNPSEVGTPSEKISQGCALVQLIGDFSSIRIQSSSLFGASDNWSMAIAGQDYNCGTPLDPQPLMARKKVSNITPKDPNNPEGNKIVTFVIELENKTATKYNDLFVENYLDEKWGAAVVAITEAPSVIWPINAFAIKGNPNFNGSSDVNLLAMNMNNMMNPGELIKIQYSIELNPALINSNLRHENRLIVGSHSQPVFLPNFEECNLPVYLPISTQLPTNPIEDIVGGTVPTNYASWLQCFGKAKIVPHPQCGKITWSFERCPKPYTQNCGNTGIWHTEFMGMDECGNMYRWRADYTSIDKNPPIWDMKPMDKTIVCNSANASSDLAMWLSTAGGAWYSDPGDELKSKITITHDFVNTNLDCASGPKTVKFTLTDACGNSSTETAKLTITDKQAPKFTSTPANVTVKCDDANVSFGTPVATDDCSTVVMSFKDTNNTVDCNFEVTQTRTWTATDACGNTATAAQTITYMPKAGGTKTAIFNVSNVSDKIASCSDYGNFDVPKVQTNCPDGVIHSSYTDEEENGACVNEKDIIRTWKFLDNCGNSYTFKQTISIYDNDAPTFDSKYPKKFVMKKNIFPVWKKLYFTQVKAQDNCSKVTMTAPVFKILDNKTVECKLMANDECGNLSNYTCLVQFEDNTSSVTSSNKSEAINSDVATAILADLEKYVVDETPIDIPIEAVIYPNPTSRVVNIVPAQGYGDIQKIHIYNLNGQNLLNMDVEGQQNKIITIDISNFPNATYIIEMMHPKKKLYRQVQKIN